ncbi:peptidyl-prolyl cis-trans isomerase CYP26-2, chloroplastic [Rosa sericea]
MLQIPKFLQSSTQCLHPPAPQPPLPILQIPGVPTSSSFPSIKQCCKLSRRELAIRSNSLLLLLLGSQSIEAFLPSRAEAEEDLVDAGSNAQEQSSNATPTCGDKSPTKRAFLDISIDGEPVGRIVIGIQEDDAPVGAARFRNLVSGAAGVSYRRKEFVKITPNYVQHGGVRSYGVDAELAKSTGSSLEVDKLTEEWESLYEKCPGIKNKAGTVGIIVRDPSKPPPKIKLVARKGKLEIDQEEVGTTPNGTEFVISTKDSPELDASTLVVGRVLEGMEVVERLGQVKTVQENTSSPYFRVAKLIGDKRAVVAERGFNRPYAKVVVTNCGLMQ